MSRGASKAATKPRRIGLAIDVVGAYGRGIVRGIMAYAMPRNWVITLEPQRWSFETVPALTRWTVDGIIAQVYNAEFQRHVVRTKLPATNVSSSILHAKLPTVVPDDAAVGVLAADYFRGRGFRQFAFVGPPQFGYSTRRRQGFAERVAAIGGTLHACDPLTQEMAAWVRALPKPIALLGCNDQWAHELLKTCRQAGIDVPGEVAILGVDNDDLINALVLPSLSSIELPTERIGFEAARMLDELLNGAAAPTQPLRLAPIGVVTRQSTNVSAITDTDVVAAMKYIREHAHEPIRVEDVLQAVPLGRRTLERRFRQTIGRSVLLEIRRARIERAKQLLTATQLSMPAIADGCGFTNCSRFGVTFRQLTRMTPSEFRRSQQAHRAGPDRSGAGAGQGDSAAQ